MIFPVTSALHTQRPLREPGSSSELKRLFCPQDIYKHLKLMESKKESIHHDPNCTQIGEKVSPLLHVPGAVCDEATEWQGTLWGRMALQAREGRSTVSQPGRPAVPGIAAGFPSGL